MHPRRGMTPDDMVGSSASGALAAADARDAEDVRGAMRGRDTFNKYLPSIARCWPSYTDSDAL